MHSGALEQAVHRQGSDSARAYLAHSGGDVEMLLTIIERTSPQLGWGTWRFEADGERLRLEVRNSPFAHAFGPSEQPVCHAVKGMLRGLADLWLGRPAQSSERQCSAQHHASCAFEARAAQALRGARGVPSSRRRPGRSRAAEGRSYREVIRPSCGLGVHRLDRPLECVQPSIGAQTITAPSWDFSWEQLGTATRHGLRKSR